MKSLVTFCVLLSIMILPLSAQSDWMQYESSSAFPFGKPHPEAPAQLQDFAPMIGICDCESLRRNNDGSWPDTAQMVWRFKYIMNGTAIQDESWKEDSYSTSIRQFNVDSNVWVVSYTASPKRNTSSPVWLGNKTGDRIVLKREQQSPGGMDGINRLTFSNISTEGFDWKGEWLNDEKGIVYPYWYIWCRKRQ